MYPKLGFTPIAGDFQGWRQWSQQAAPKLPNLNLMQVVRACQDCRIAQLWDNENIWQLKQWFETNARGNALCALNLDNLNVAGDFEMAHYCLNAFMLEVGIK